MDADESKKKISNRIISWVNVALSLKVISLSVGWSVGSVTFFINARKRKAKHQLTLELKLINVINPLSLRKKDLTFCADG